MPFHDRTRTLLQFWSCRKLGAGDGQTYLEADFREEMKCYEDGWWNDRLPLVAATAAVCT